MPPKKTIAKEKVSPSKPKAKSAAKKVAKAKSKAKSKASPAKKTKISKPKSAPKSEMASPKKGKWTCSVETGNESESDSDQHFTVCTLKGPRVTFNNITECWYMESASKKIIELQLLEEANQSFDVVLNPVGEDVLVNIIDGGRENKTSFIVDYDSSFETAARKLISAVDEKKKFPVQKGLEASVKHIMKTIRK